MHKEESDFFHIEPGLRSKLNHKIPQNLKPGPNNIQNEIEYSFHMFSTLTSTRNSSTSPESLWRTKTLPECWAVAEMLGPRRLDERGE